MDDIWLSRSSVPFSEIDCRTAQLFAFHSQCRQQCQGLWVRTEPGWEVAEKTEPVLIKYIKHCSGQYKA